MDGSIGRTWSVGMPLSSVVVVVVLVFAFVIVRPTLWVLYSLLARTAASEQLRMQHTPAMSRSRRASYTPVRVTSTSKSPFQG
jgi:hypothetical protein